MGQKVKSKQKIDWIFCEKTGIGYHSSDAETFNSWSQDSSSDTSHIQPPFPSIIHKTFRSIVSCSDKKTLVPSFDKFASIYLPVQVCVHCDIGFGSHVLVTTPSQEIVLRAFTQKDVNHCLVTRNSWLFESLKRSKSISGDRPQEVTVTRFNGHVATPNNVTVEFIPNLDNDSDMTGVFNKLKLFLVDKILKTNSILPFDYYGKMFDVLIHVPELESDNSLSDNFGDMSLADYITSTPVKRKGSSSKDKENYFTITTSTSLNLQNDSKEDDNLPIKNVKVGGLSKQMNILLESCSAIFSDSQGRGVNGILLYGPPGVGKSILALAVCSKLKCNYRIISGPELYSKYYGETETKIRDLFSECGRLAPCVLVLDDLDSFAPKKDGDMMGDQERRVLSTLQTCLDRIKINQVFVLATTSKIDNIPTSLRRPGRLDLELELAAPDVEARLEILNLYLDTTQHTLSMDDIKLIARDTHGFVGADVSNLFSTSLLFAQKNGHTLQMSDFEAARVQVKPSAMREVQVQVPSVTWADIGGLQDLKLKLRQAVDWPIKHPEVFTRMGIKPPRGVLMYGPPGCSKTMIAKALANESGLNFLSIKGPELFSKWVGESEKAVRDLFRRARSVAPSIIFFDEIDALGASRGAGGSNQVAERVLAQLLTEMDGVVSLANVTVVAATNRPDMMDRALLRPGRLDRVVYVPLPDIQTRRQVLSIHTKNIPIDESVDLDAIAENTEGYSGAEVAAICNEAALAALEEKAEADTVTSQHFNKALYNVKPRIKAELIQIYNEFQNKHDKS